MHSEFFIRAIIPVLMATLLFSFSAFAEEASSNVNIRSLELGPLSENVSPEVLASYLKGNVQLQAGKYQLGPGDQISIHVYDADEFNQQNLLIRPDGFVSIPPIGDVDVQKLTVDQLKEVIEKKLKAYLVRPDVTVTVKSLRPAIVYVMGEVRTPGAYQYQRDGASGKDGNEQVELTLSNVLRKAGGLNSMADLTSVAIVHPASGSSETVDLWRLLRHGDVRQDPVLSAGDVVLVERAKSRISDEEFRQLSRSNLYAEEFPVVVMGEVQKPGKIMLTADSPSLDAAIAQALGFNGNANRHKVLIARPNGQGGFSKLYANPNKADLALLPNDVVYVMRSRVDLAKDEIQNLTERIRDLGTGTFSLWRSFDPVRFGVGF